MFQYHCLNPIAERGLNMFSEDYTKTENINEADAVLEEAPGCMIWSLAIL